MNNFIFLIGLFLFTSCSTSYRSIVKEQNSYSQYLEILQISYMDEKQFTFIIADNLLYVFQGSLSSKKLKKIYVLKIRDKNTLTLISNNLKKSHSLKNEYEKQSFDGFRWEIYFHVKNNTKVITVENMEVKELNELFEVINSLIPTKKGCLIYTQ